MRVAALLLAAILAAPAFAVQPDEILPDPALEARARDISQELRCLVCRNENIDDSNAQLARDLRLLVRERLVAGDSNAEVVAFVVDRYGEYVLLNPTAGGANLILWIAGPAMLAGGLGLAALYLRRRRTAPDAASAALSDEERARLAEILKD
ncbi:cytochrome c-type biogenesis protein CcmH [Cereibacter johrii]|uniref:cytochrome c-type biogenesis protein n=1 Tax=Cereibacter johrii TaxID=445629 RepID=UPI000C6D29BF|nr:cytochrome c-type biogenesis protein [Cereibacter johrii]QCP85714.1 cytochrome c-type biogenesis protein CcmH [Cereibacter sphaeroides]RAZ88093.1 cytochrome c-type biogenesis protein CcmH [Cereibacter johrii]